jgi:hypothetical protein
MMTGVITHCPQCKIEVLPVFDVKELLEMLESGQARFYCISCDTHWKPEQQEREELAKLLTHPTADLRPRAVAGRHTLRSLE